MGFVMPLYVACIVCFPHVVDVRAFSISSVLCAFVVVLSRCFFCM